MTHKAIGICCGLLNGLMVVGGLSAQASARGGLPPRLGLWREQVRGEQIVRQSDSGGKCWTIVRPTPVWSPGMAPHYVRLLRMIRAGLYFHVGEQPVYKSYSYIDNNVHQIASLAEADSPRLMQQPSSTVRSILPTAS